MHETIMKLTGCVST